MDFSNQYLHSSIGKKQIVAVTGLMLILFVFGHMAGNFFIYGGPDAYNAYAKKLSSLRPGLYLVEFGLLLVFLVHMHVTFLLVMENIRARSVPYSVQKPKGERSWATRLMPYTGSIIIAFVIWHLLDFTFTDHHGARAILDGKDYGLYGVVYNAFSDITHSLLYIIAVACLGLHLSHGLESFFQTFGFNHPRYTPMIQNISRLFGLLMFLGYSSMPVFVLIKNFS
ncbi:MAG: succinate dehydrogenase cytochrome b subunit [Candidatus Omnitrophota bacterium]|nr:succinate dehydrogenase cytochrome b subunit [Candidatus Omnitrophota bacterium]MDZ4242585.1 succinate dehydrogenase cytochrome b subunit [Candidatus Omnitrophota bacterium]